jgi:hypothetical protein
MWCFNWTKFLLNRVEFSGLLTMNEIQAIHWMKMANDSELNPWISTGVIHRIRLLIKLHTGILVAFCFLFSSGCSHLLSDNTKVHDEHFQVFTPLIATLKSMTFQDPMKFICFKFNPADNFFERTLKRTSIFSFRAFHLNKCLQKYSQRWSTTKFLFKNSCKQNKEQRNFFATKLIKNSNFSAEYSRNSFKKSLANKNQNSIIF